MCCVWLCVVLCDVELLLFVVVVCGCWFVLSLFVVVDDVCCLLFACCCRCARVVAVACDGLLAFVVDCCV